MSDAGRPSGDEWQQVAEPEFEENLALVEVDGRRICVARVQGALFAFDTLCSHARADLHDGELEGFEIECPWHGGRFDVRSGEAVLGPARHAVRTYATRVDEGGLSLLIPQHTEGDASPSATADL